VLIMSKVKKMSTGGMGGMGGINKISDAKPPAGRVGMQQAAAAIAKPPAGRVAMQKAAAPIMQSRVQAAAKPVPAYAKPYAAASAKPVPTQSQVSKIQNAFSQQKSGAMPMSSQSAPDASRIASIQNMKQRIGDAGATMLKAQKTGVMKKGGKAKKPSKTNW
jgi:hypothetical protein